MRILGGIVLALFSLANVGCDVTLQPSVQGEWSDFHKEDHKVSKDAREESQKPAETKAAEK